MNKLLPLGTEITFTIGRLIFVQNSLELRAQALTHPPPSPLCLSSGALVSLSPALGFSLSRKLEGAEKRFNHQPIAFLFSLESFWITEIQQSVVWLHISGQVFAMPLRFPKREKTMHTMVFSRAGTEVSLHARFATRLKGIASVAVVINGNTWVNPTSEYLSCSATRKRLIPKFIFIVLLTYSSGSKTWD